MSLKTSITEITENNNKHRGNDVMMEEVTSKGLLMPSSDFGLWNCICICPCVSCPCGTAYFVQTTWETLVYVFHPGRQGARDTVIPLVCYVEPLVSVPMVLGIIKQPQELLSGVRAHPFVPRLCNSWDTDYKMFGSRHCHNKNDKLKGNQRKMICFFPLGF